ncbi:MAG: cytochrome c oxidase subunit 3, partial [Betaproteobacteria bacterium AqS2]|nr:cytochrome c oxidase subunit 3 [Betaproteobacteria bacterium AqS2]
MAGNIDPTVLAYGHEDEYYVPQPSRWPLLTALSAATLVSGMFLVFNGVAGGLIVLLLGLAWQLANMYGWWRDVVRESESGSYRTWEDVSFRWGMAWFIFSEVMFFACFFGALFYARGVSVPDLASEISRTVWPGFQATWPTMGPYRQVDFETIPAFGIPLLNTAILLLSGATITAAHWELRRNRRGPLAAWLAATILLGIIFLALQAAEYVHAYQDLNLRLDSGIYGSTFFMLTGFHGLHVTIGVLSLIVILARCMNGHFTPAKHFGFEAVAWYWHFVDVVWL